MLPPRRPPGRPAGALRAGGARWPWVFVVASAVIVLGFFGVVFVLNELKSDLFGGYGGTASARHSDLHEVVVESAPTRDKIAVIDVQGLISSDVWDPLGGSLVTHVEAQLDRASEDDHVKAVVLRIDSPGGEVLASDEIYKLVMDFQEKHDKPVVAAMGTVAASGGYYVAAPCRWVVANELTITGSIGVIMHSYNWRGLMDKIGVRPQVFKSGELKDMLSPDKASFEITEEERRIVQNLVNETFERFQAIIEEGRGLARSRNEDNGGEDSDRGRTLARNWKDFADGRLLSGKDAWKLGFVDELGDFDTAIQRARKLARIESARLVQYLRPMGFGSLLRFLGESPVSRVKIDLGIDVPKLRSGLYFLAPSLVR